MAPMVDTHHGVNSAKVLGYFSNFTRSLSLTAVNTSVSGEGVGTVVGAAAGAAVAAGWADCVSGWIQVDSRVMEFHQ